VVLVNFEDHLEIIILPDSPSSRVNGLDIDSIKEGLGRLIKLV
jgi:hypothetical protein